MSAKRALNVLSLLIWSALNLTEQNIWLRAIGLAVVAMALCNILDSFAKEQQP